MYSEGPSCGKCKYFLLRAHNEYPCSDCINGSLWIPKEEERSFLMTGRRSLNKIWNCRTHEWEDEE